MCFCAVYHYACNTVLRHVFNVFFTTKYDVTHFNEYTERRTLDVGYVCA